MLECKRREEYLVCRLRRWRATKKVLTTLSVLFPLFLFFSLAFKPAVEVLRPVLSPSVVEIPQIRF